MNSPFRIALFVIPYSLFLILVSAHSAYAEITRTLQLGSTGADVRELQVLLNSDPLTTVSSSGTGSPGKESEYFGILTKRAVEAFQKKYAPEVLFPAGIWQSTGIVGMYSRNKLNTLAKTTAFKDSVTSEDLLPPSIRTAIPTPTGGTATEESGSNSTSIYSIFASKSKPLVFNLSRYQAKRGASVSVQGSGFLPTGNSVVLDSDNRIDNLSSANGSSLDFIIPDNVPQGAYNMSVQNKNGSSFNEAFGNFFTVTDNPKNPPSVFSISPTAVKYDADSRITIYGEGFSSVGNDIFTDFGAATNISSKDGKTLTLELSTFSGFAQAGTQASVFSKAKVSVPVFVVVKNDAGISSARVSFLLQY